MPTLLKEKNNYEPKAPEFTEEKFETLKAAISDTKKCKDMDYFGTFCKKEREYDVWLKHFGAKNKELLVLSEIPNTDNFIQDAEYSCTITPSHLDLQDGYISFKLFIQDRIDWILSCSKNNIRFEIS